MSFSPELQRAARRAQASPEDRERLARAFISNARARKMPALMHFLDQDGPRAEEALLTIGRARMDELVAHMVQGTRSAYVSLVANRYAEGQTSGQLYFGKTGIGLEDFVQGLTAQKLALIDWLGDQDFAPRTFADLVCELEGLFADIESAYAVTYQSLLEDVARVRAENAAIRDLNQALETHAAELSRRNAELHVMAEVGQAVTAAGNLTDLLNQSLTRLCDLLGAKYGAIWRWDDAMGGLQIQAQTRFVPAEVDAINLTYRGRLTGSPVLSTFMEARVFAVPDALHDPSFAAFRHYAETMDFRGTIYLPLLYQGKATGVLSLYFQDPHEFPPEELQFLLSVSSQLALAIRLGVNVEALRKAHSQLEVQVQERTRELQSEKAFLDRIVTHVPAGVALLDKNLIYQWANPGYSRMTGVPLAKIVGCGVFDALPGSESQIGPLIQKVRETDEPVKETSYPLTYRVDGEMRTTYWDFSYVPLPDGAILVLATEVSERVERERLQREKIEQLKQTDRMKDQFLSILSHELRTPLNAIMGFGSILEDELEGPLNERQQTYLSRMLGGAETLLALINDLLDMSRIQAGKFALEPYPFPIGRAVRSVLDNLAPLAEKRHQALRLDVPPELPTVLADEQRVKQVLTNLINNAIKFTPEGGSIQVTVKPEAASLRISVEDTGIGIAPEDMDKLFKPYTQLDMTDTRSVGGTGLGLSISKALVEAHGGEIGVHSEPGQGSCFWFTLPLSKD